MANYKEYRIAVDNNIVNLEQVETERKDAVATDASILPKKKDSVSKLVAVDAVKKAANYAVQNYGNLTGDTLGQTAINEAVGLIGMGAMAMTGPVGLVAVGVQVGLTFANRGIEVAKSRNVSKSIRTRLGIVNGGSR